MTATPAQKKKAEYGDVFIPVQFGQTCGTMRGGKDNGCLFSGKAEDDYVEKTSDNGPKKESSDDGKACKIYEHKGILMNADKMGCRAA